MMWKQLVNVPAFMEPEHDTVPRRSGTSGVTVEKEEALVSESVPSIETFPSRCHISQEEDPPAH